jgi:hypothetical protein
MFITALAVTASSFPWSVTKIVTFRCHYSFDFHGRSVTLNGAFHGLVLTALATKPLSFAE